MVVAGMVETPVAMVAVVAAVATAVAETSVAMVVATAVTVEAAVDVAHARTPATHKAAVSQPSRACSKRRLRVSARSSLTKMPNPQAMSRQASPLPASLPAAIAVTTAVAAAVAALVAVVVAVAADVRVVVKAAPATSARSTVVNRTR
jgi:hypothetical protein